ncbi:MAG TPA: phytanoyl-CoA dioxygenase family protein [Blastocatellia bacterium]|nr:phytanoyl-CoA dioxygenase family protein [Blastocatellia bacterium]
MTTSHVEAIEQNGFAIIAGVITPETVTDLIRELASVHSGRAVIRRRQSNYGIRNLLAVVPAVRALAESAAIRSLVEPVLGKEAIVARGIFFDKTPETNWSVAWHQDLAVAVKKRIEVVGFGPWSVKAGVPHALAPADVLERMLAVRIHLDDTDETNGALRVFLGSHRFGRLNDEEVERWEHEGTSVTCAVSKGAVLAMRPLLLHSSHSSQRPAHRRVIHLEFASGELPAGLEWHGAEK